MAGYLNQAHLLSPVESKSFSLDDKSDSLSATRTEMTTSVRWVPDVGDSPLKIFVLAKKKINDIFIGIQSYVEESNKFLSSMTVESGVVSEQLVKQTSNFRERITGIQDVLTRNHMKVVFFGRTSNGKSTVINALLQDKILPSGLGHTTNCFLQVEGGDTQEPYLLTEDSHDPQNVQSVAQLAHALNSEKLGDSTLVRILWPKEKYHLLRDDVVLVDSPGIDVSPNLDEWIDKHCLNADVFVLVANAESTLMLTEKNFFHKVSERLSKPNIFILNNRWDASAFEPEFLEGVRKQHLDRTTAFLVDELHVCTRQEAEDRVFFVSAREMLQARLKIKEGLAPHMGALADGFQKRYFEFQDFERKFEECLSKSAVKTKFEQHTQQGKAIIKALQHIMELAFVNSHKKKKEKMEMRKEHKDKLEFTQQQLHLLTDEVKHHIGHLVHKVEQQVAKALNEEIHRLNVLVNEFERPFHPDNLVLSVYKKVWASNGKSTGINALLQDKILPSGQGHTTNCFLQVEGGDTQEPYLLTEDSHDPQNVQSVAQLAHTLNSEKLGDSTLENNFFHKVSERLSKPNIFILNNWWDASAFEPKFLERFFFVMILLNYHNTTEISEGLLSGLLSSLQKEIFGYRELSSTFARLCQLVVEVINEMEGEIRTLDTEVEKLDECLTMSRILRNKAGYLMSKLETFSQQYLQCDQ
ncbi:mitofusin-2-like [Tachypleus tridentatus]|uniref:mitofusin-2-like n=1 Tax=Tachypleus tridentatus TaxID=6853 RepID=UPI003FD4C2E9